MSLADPVNLCNSSFERNARRAIRFPNGAEINETALNTRVQAAVKLNERSTPCRLTPRSSRPATAGSVSLVCGAFGTFAHQAYAACLRGRLNSNVIRIQQTVNRKPRLVPGGSTMLE